MVLIPALLAANTFSLIPPTGRTLPVKTQLSGHGQIRSHPTICRQAIQRHGHGNTRTRTILGSGSRRQMQMNLMIGQKIQRLVFLLAPSLFFFFLFLFLFGF